MSVNSVRRELTADGFAFRELTDRLPWQHLIVFAPQPAP